MRGLELGDGFVEVIHRVGFVSCCEIDEIKRLLDIGQGSIRLLAVTYSATIRVRSTLLSPELNLVCRGVFFWP